MYKTKVHIHGLASDRASNPARFPAPPSRRATFEIPPPDPPGERISTFTTFFLSPVEKFRFTFFSRITRRESGIRKIRAFDKRRDPSRGSFGNSSRDDRCSAGRACARRRQMARRAGAAPSGGKRRKRDRHALPTLGRIDEEGGRGAGGDARPKRAEGVRLNSGRDGLRGKSRRSRGKKKGRDALSKRRDCRKKKRSAWAYNVGTICRLARNAAIAGRLLLISSPPGTCVSPNTCKQS